MYLGWHLLKQHLNGSHFQVAKVPASYIVLHVL